MTPKDAAFHALETATISDMTVGEARVGIVMALGLHGHQEPRDVLGYASDAILSDADVLPGEMALRMSAWAERLEARGE